ncbi:hypothetical protein LEMLEM_LOCUS24147 [Lemmus lemmus]
MDLFTCKTEEAIAVPSLRVTTTGDPSLLVDQKRASMFPGNSDIIVKDAIPLR